MPQKKTTIFQAATVAGGQHFPQVVPELRQVLELELENGKLWRVHPLLLRERSGPRQDSTKQRLFEIVDKVVDGSSLHHCELTDEGQTLHLEFSDGHQGTYDVPSLLDELANENRKMPDVELWGPHNLNLQLISRFDALHDAGEVAEQLLTSGIAIVRNVKAEVGSGCAWLGERLGVVRATEWGTTFHVKVGQESKGQLTEDVAYTNEAIDLHVDNPYRRPVPGYWCLHAISMGCGDGGATLVCDGFAVSEQLRVEDPVAFETLTTIPVSFRYTDGCTVDLVDERPHIELAPCPKGGRPRVQRITYSGRLDEVPLHLSPEQAQAYYRARAVWLGMARKNAVEFKLKEGDLIILDNERVMHGRTQIKAHNAEECTGRFLEGCYIDKDGVTSRYFLHKSAHKHVSSRHSRALSVRLQQTPAKVEVENPTASHAYLVVDHAELPFAAVSFRSLTECSEQDVKHMAANYASACSAEQLTQRAIGLLSSAANAQQLGCQVSLYEHCLQSASRAWADGAAEEIVVAALLHDVGELLSPSNHGEIPAAMLAPYVSPETQWVLAHHEIFQMHYYAHHIGMNRNVRDKYIDHPYFEACRKFCMDYDAPSFDPDYPTRPLEDFVQILIKIFSQEPYWWDHSHPKRGAVMPSSQVLAKL